MGFGDTFRKIAPALINPVAAIGTGSMIAGDYLQMREQEEENARNRELTRQTNEQNYQMQKEFAQHGIRWKVEDAVAAGLHPLAALGASTQGASPSFQIEGGPGISAKGEFYGRMGQNFARAAQATMTAEERALTNENVKKATLENQLLEWQIADVKKSVTGQPPLPAGVVETPLTLVAAEKDRKWQEIGQYPSVAYMQSPTGLVPIMPPNLAEALESDEANQKQWTLRYKGGPNIAPTERPSYKKLPSGAVGWVWSYPLQEWQPVTRQQAEMRGLMAAERFRKPQKRFNTMRREYNEFIR